MPRIAIGFSRARLGLLTSFGILVLVTGCGTFSTSQVAEESTFQQKPMEAQAAPAPVQEERVAEAQVAPPPPAPEPAPMAPAPQSVVSLPGPLSLYFDFDQALPKLNPQSEATLKALADFLQKHDDRQLVIAGYADERGTEAYNLTLGEKRAVSVKQFLESQGVQAKQLETTSFGKDKPVCKSHKPTCWKKNRRAQLSVK